MKWQTAVLTGLGLLLMVGLLALALVATGLLSDGITIGGGSISTGGLEVDYDAERLAIGLGLAGVLAVLAAYVIVSTDWSLPESGDWEDGGVVDLS